MSEPKKRRDFLKIGLGVAAAALAASTGYLATQGPAAGQTTTSTGTGAGAAGGAKHEIGSVEYTPGHTLRVLTNSPAADGVRHVAALAKEQLGVDIEVIDTSFAENPEKSLLIWTSKSPEPEVMTHYQFMTGSAARYAQRLNEYIDEWGLRGPYMADNCGWVVRMISTYDDKYKWAYQPGEQEHQVGMGIGADQEMYWFRKDWFSDPNERAEFKARYGYEMVDPNKFGVVIGSVSELCDLAQHFYRPDEEMYGFSWPNQLYALAENYWAPSRGATTADAVTGAPMVDKKAWADTLYIQKYMYKYSIGAVTDWLEAAELFAQGKVAITFSFQFFAPLIFGESSTLGTANDGKVGYCHPPAWVKPRGPAHPLPEGITSWEVPVGSVAGTTDYRYFVGGWNFNINPAQDEARKRAAFNFIQWYTSPEIGKIVSLDVGHFTPRWSVYLDKDVAAKWGVTPTLAAAWGNPADVGSEKVWCPPRAPEIQTWFAAAVGDLQDAVTGDLPVEESLKRQTDAMVRIWKDAGIPTE